MYQHLFVPADDSNLLGRFEKRAQGAGVAFTAHHVATYLINQATMEEAETAGGDMMLVLH